MIPAEERPSTSLPSSVTDLTISEDHDGYRYTWRQWALTILISRVSERSGNVMGELAVIMHREGKDRLLTRGTINLSSFESRARLAKRLERLATGPEWNPVVETSCVKTEDFHRQGQPSESLEPTDLDRPACFVLNPLIYERNPTMVFGPGESGKSFWALFLACLLASGGQSTDLAVAPDGHNVLYLDWELQAPEQRARVRQLRAGHPELTRSPMYRRMHVPLASCATELRRDLHAHDIGVIIIDSVGMATGGEMERSQDPVAFFNALGSFGVASLLIHHVPKAADDDKKRTPYGSVYYYNLSRSIWEMRLVAEPESDTRTLALFHYKNNLGRHLPPKGYTLKITDEVARFAPCDPLEEPELARGFTVRERIKRLLKDHTARTVTMIADGLQVEPETVRTVLNRYKGRDWMNMSTGGGKGHEAEWGVL